MIYKQYKSKDDGGNVVKGSAKSKLNISKKDIIDAEFEDLKEDSKEDKNEESKKT